MSVTDRWADNPFFVLELSVAASRAEVERAGQKWLDMLAVGIGRAAIYMTPLGARARTPELVRSATAALRDPERRVVHELWYLDHAPTPPDDDDVVDVDDGDIGFDAMTPLGWARP